MYSKTVYKCVTGPVENIAGNVLNSYRSFNPSSSTTARDVGGVGGTAPIPISTIKEL
jgi:hypothetical protein